MRSTLKSDLEPLIRNKQWDAVVARLATENVVSEASGKIYFEVVGCIFEAFWQKGVPLHVLDAFLQVCPEGVRGRQGGENLIHRAVSNNVSVEVINRLIEKYPEGLTDADASDGAFPIHFAVTDASLGIVNCLIDAFPSVVRQTDKYGRLPITHATWNNKPDAVEVFNRLIEAYPEGVQQPDNFGRLPIHFPPLRPSPMALEIVDRLIEAYPEGVRQPNKDGDLPIHRAACESESSLEVVNRLIEAYPEGVRQANNDGDLPIHRAACRSMEVVNRLIEAYPEGVKKRNNKGQLPIHCAVQIYRPNICKKPVDVMRVLIDAYPMSIVLTYPHKSTHLLPSEQVIVNEHSADVISFLENEQKKFMVDLAQIIVGRNN